MAVPEWFRDAKLGLLIHWGLYSLPGWAPLSGELAAVLRQGGPTAWFTHQPYAEWYWNALRIPGSPTWQYHRETYGATADYPDLAPAFHAAADRWQPEPWAALSQAAGARYLILVSKHHDGFLLWPSQTPPAYRPDWQLRRDVVGELAAAVRARGLRFGLYYSGGLDWTFNARVIRDFADLFLAIPRQPAYGAYVDAQWRELIVRYAPAVLWNDIGYPGTADLRALVAFYRAHVPEGIINDRFCRLPPALLRGLALPGVRQLWNSLVQRSILAGRGGCPPWPGQPAPDFATAEAGPLPHLRLAPWECCRGLTISFAYNRQAGAEHHLSVTQLVHLLVDVVSKNGNLLLGVGAQGDGTIPPLQQERLVGLGRWLAANGEALFGTRPWQRAEGQTAEGWPVRFTRRGSTLYMVILGQPQGGRLTLRAAPPGAAERVWWLAGRQAWPATRVGSDLVITLPERLPPSPALALALPDGAT